jgi:hypothetical protein
MTFSLKNPRLDRQVSGESAAKNGLVQKQSRLDIGFTASACERNS